MPIEENLKIKAEHKCCKSNCLCLSKSQSIIFWKPVGNQFKNPYNLVFKNYLSQS